MTNREIASAVLGCIGGVRNVVANSLCMTRLRVTVANPLVVKRESIDEIDGVLGTATRGANGIEVVFGMAAVRPVYQEFCKLTGLDSPIEPLIGSRRLENNFQVHISPGKRKSFAAQADALSQEVDADAAREIDDDDFTLDHLADLLESDEASQALDDEASEQPERRLLVINGPNLNMLGIREPKLYGAETYDAMLQLCKETAKAVGFVDCSCFQSNHEGAIVDAIQDAFGVFDGIVINPGAYTHTSVAILDALKAVSIPAIEVHISKVNEREDFRQISYVRLACFETIMGKGIDGYRIAIEHMAEHLGM